MISKLNPVTSFRAWQAAGKPRYGYIHDEMMKHKMTYRKAIKDKDVQRVVEVSNDLHDCLIKKDMNSFWKTWRKKVETRNSKVNVEGLNDDDVIAAEFAKFFESICSVENRILMLIPELLFWICLQSIKCLAFVSRSMSSS